MGASKQPMVPPVHCKPETASTAQALQWVRQGRVEELLLLWVEAHLPTISQAGGSREARSLEKMGEGKEESVRNLLHPAAGSVKQTPGPRSWGGIWRSQQSHSLGKATGSGGRSPLPRALCHHWQTCRFFVFFLRHS